MNVNEIVNALRETLDLPDLAARSVPVDDTFVSIAPEHLRPAVQVLIERFALTHLSTITGQDNGETIELLYHFWDRRGLTMRVALDRQDARVATLTDLIPGASFYEREVAEMLGVAIEGSKDAGPFLLPDDWEEGAPLRRRDADG